MLPLYLITIGGFTFSGRDAAIIAVLVIVVLGMVWFAFSRSRRAK